MSKFPFVLYLKVCVIVCLLCSVIAVKSQNEIFVQFISTSPFLPYFSESEIRKSNPFFLNVTAVNPDPSAQYVLWMEINGPGIHLISEDARNRVFQFIPGEHLSLSSSDLASFFDINQFEMNGLTREDYLEAGLPDGTYRVCFQMMDVAYDRSERVSNPACQVFVVRKQLPPIITYPKANHTMDLMLPSVFTWNDQAITSEIIQYEFSIFENQEGLNTEELLTYFRPVLQEVTYSRFFTYSKNRFELKNGKKYIAFVRAIPNSKQILFHNNGYSQGIPFSTKSTSHSGSREDECPSLACEYEFNAGSYNIIVHLTGGTPGTTYTILLDNVLYGTSNQNPIVISNVNQGQHLVSVGILDICNEDCTVNVGDCQPGTACDDNDPCTSGETYDNDCHCTGGEPTEEVSIVVGDPVYHFACDYCVDLLPSTYGDYLSFQIDQIEFNTYWGYKIVLNESSNGLTDFHFPYFIEDLGITAVQLLVADLNHWIEVNDHVGTVTSIVSYNQSCNTRLGLSFTDVNIGMVATPKIIARSNTGVKFEILFHELDCDPTNQIVGYYITPVLEEPTECILYSGNVSWSGGLPYDGVTVFTPSLNNCYEVTVTCKGPCPYTAIGPATNCICTIGDPCTPNGPINPCLIYVYNENCNCVPVNPDFPDSDEDGICDLVDLCPGYNDLQDEDEDGIPDGCDLCPCDDDVLTPEQIILLTDNDPANDAGICDVCPCDDATDIQVTSLGHDNCDYCLNANVNALPLSNTQVVSQYQYRDINGLHTIPLTGNWQIKNEEYFESEEFTWISDALPNGEYCDRYEDPQFAKSGIYSMRFRNNGIHARMTSPVLNFEDDCLIKFSFSFISSGFDNSFDDLKLLMSVDGGSYNLVQSWEHTTNFQNNVRQDIVLYIPGTASAQTKFRFLCDATSPDDAIYVDDVKIYGLPQLTSDCVNTHSISNINSFLSQLLLKYNQQGTVSYFSGTNGICGDGQYIVIENSTFGFESISFTGSEGDFTLQFSSPDCGELYPGQQLFELKAIAACAESTYEWNTGATTQSILIPSTLAGYIVTITCNDGCEYIETYGNQGCIAGEPCTIVGDPCYTSGTYNAYCKCEPDPDFPDDDGDGIPNACDDCDVPPDYDGNHNGIPDCYEVDCPCDVLPELVLTETPGQLCKSCFPVSLNAGETLTGVTMSNPGGSFSLQSIQGFHFPYCATLTDNEACEGEYPSLSQFRRDFVNWAYSMGLEVRMIFEDNSAHCTAGPKFYIEGLKGITTFNIYFSNVTLSGTSDGCAYAESASTYTLSVGPATNCESCSTITKYAWSDPSVGNVSSITPVFPEGGYSVTVTCAEGCQFVIEREGNCLVGTPCNDLNPCTINDHYDEHCFCVGTISDVTDSDGDGVPDICDLCPGFVDRIDDDHDGVPNGCDECLGHDDALLHDADPGNDPQNCIVCTLLELPLYTSDLSLSGWTGCGSNVVYIIGFNVFYPGSNTSTNVTFSSTSGFQPRYCVSGNCPGGVGTSSQMAADIKTWLLAHSDNPDVITQVASNTFKVLHSTYKLEKVSYTCGGSPAFKLFTNTTESGTLPVFSPCDDGDPCTTGDHWNEVCRCVGTLADDDGDNIPNCEDNCPNENSNIDDDGDGVPDCEDNEVILLCNGNPTLFCTYYYDLLGATDNYGPVVVKKVDLGSISYDPKMISISLVEVTTALYELMEAVNYQPLNFPYPQLVDQLQNHIDANGNSIVDYIDPYLYLPSGSASNDPYGYLDQSLWDLACAKMSQIQLSVLVRFCFYTVNDVSDPGNPGYCFMDDQVPEYAVYPGCATELKIDVYEDENCTLRRSDTHCPIEFTVDCSGRCDFHIVEILLDDVPPPGSDCGSSGNPVIGTPCDKTPESCALANPGMPCAVWRVVPNPAYDLNTNPGVTPCLCEAITVSENSNVLVGDIDGDEVCDDLDQCPDEDDDSDHNGNPDNDGDGINDCHDSCPDVPGVVGDYCDDMDGRTFGDVIGEDCTCKGHYIDWDHDGIPEFGDCHSAFDDDGDGYIDAIVDDSTIIYDVDGLIIDIIAGADGLPDCDVCPGLDDTELNADGIPICLQPPYTPIGCPIAFEMLDGVGIVLVYDASEIQIDKIPKPISLLYELIVSGDHFYKNLPYLLYTDIRESDGKYEVLYSAPEIAYAGQTLGYVSITYSNHQQCIFTNHEPDIVSLGCPDKINYFFTTEDLVLTFNTDPELVIDPTILDDGDISFHLISESGTDLVDPSDPSEPLSLSYSSVQVTHDLQTGIVTITFPVGVLGADINTYSGTITMVAQELTCDINAGDLVLDCVDEHGEAIAIGEPCDDHDPCTEHDAWAETSGGCNCVGQAKPDDDGDGICNDMDPGFSYLMCPTHMSSANNVVELTFEPQEPFHIDPQGISGEIKFQPTGLSQVTLQLSLENTLTNGSTLIAYLTSGLDVNSFNGVVTLPNLLECHYTNGNAEVCAPGIVNGNPCDDGDICTHHDKYVDCECVGEQGYDSDLDGICDANDPCPHNDCPCPTALEVQDDPENPGEPWVNVVNGNEVEVMLVDVDDPSSLHLNIHITGGEEDIDLTNLPFSNPVIIPNLPYGYYYIITITAVCQGGEEHEVEVEVDIPLAEGQFVCGIEIKDIDLSTQNLLGTLKYEDVFTASDFDITVKNAEGSLGKFTGSGYIKIPYFKAARINVSFANIVISADMQMIQGVINVNGFGLAILGDELSDLINGALDNILNVLDEIDEILDAIIPLLDEIDELIATTGQMVPNDIKECLQIAKKALADYLATNPDKTLQETKDHIIELTKDIDDCMDAYNTALATILDGLIEFFPYYIDAVANDISICDWSQLTPNYLASDQKYKPQFIGAIDQINNSWNGSNTGMEEFEEHLSITESLAEPTLPTTDLTTYYISNILQYDFCEAMKLLDQGFEQMDTPEEITDYIKTMTSLIIELDSKVLDNIGKDISNHVLPSDLYGLYKNDLNNAFKNLIIKKAYKN